MITRSAYREAQRRAVDLLRRTGLALTADELESVAVADFGLGELDETGAQILTLLDTPESAVKLIVLFPGQTLPEHRHPPLGAYPGKAETLRCEVGAAYVYTEGEVSTHPACLPPDGRRATYTVWHETALTPGRQITLAPNRRHWFQAGHDGAVVWSFSSRATDVADVFTDPEISRETVVRD
ncbi:MAG: D-lyxose/D-mannose family sugar isomerase [Anaerolineae bacterium]|jgi:D-lyxose ketol-isomerase|nr:D-lyxose/D-mannose family sugar isomerase [Anaerolineae bacterium]